MKISKTKWIFIVAAKNEPDRNHIWDAFTGILKLHEKGISQKQLYLFIENKSSDVYSIEKTEYINNHDENFESYYQEYELSEMFTILDNAINSEYVNCILFISAHGSINGISSKEILKPYNFISKFNQLQYFKNIIIYFGQCYSGIYNYINLDTVAPRKKIVLAGASGFYPSISLGSSDNEHFLNVFLLKLFEWYSNFLDIDGDGNFSIMDSFKYAAVNTDEIIQCRKFTSFLYAMTKYKDVFNKEISKMTDDEKKAIESILQDISIVHEPWLLNTKEACNLSFT